MNRVYIKEHFKFLFFLHRKYRNLRAEVLGRINPQYLANDIFYNRFHRNIDWNNPIDLNEKIQWLKFNSDTKMWTLCADKYRVREYLTDKGLSDILIPLYGVWDDANCIDFGQLPKSFILKTNHGSGDVIRVLDKTNVNELEIKKKLNKLLKTKYGVSTAEPHYLGIKPCVVAEELLSPGCDFSSTLVDYKIWCFNGNPHHIWACYNRIKGSVCVETHDLKWNYMPKASVFYNEFLEGGGKVPRPKNLDRMLEIAKILSKDFPVVRVDLYESNGRVYFGEMTFTSQGGYMEFYSQEFLKEMGNIIKLPK